MITRVPPSSASQRSSSAVHVVAALTAVALGLAAPVVFFWTYAFNDSPDGSDHLFFLTRTVGVVAAVALLSGAFNALSEPRTRWQAFAGAGCVALSVYAAVGSGYAFSASSRSSTPGSDTSQHFKVDQVVTAGSPTAQVESLPRHVSMLSLENAGDLIPQTDGEPNPEAVNRTTVTFDANTGTMAGNHNLDQYVKGGRAVDEHVRGASAGSLPDEVQRMNKFLGYTYAEGQSVIITRR